MQLLYPSTSAQVTHAWWCTPVFTDWADDLNNNKNNTPPHISITSVQYSDQCSFKNSSETALSRQQKQLCLCVDIFYGVYLQEMTGSLKKMAKQTNTEQKSIEKVETKTHRGLSDSKSHLLTIQLPFGFGCKAIRKEDCFLCHHCPSI